MIVSFDPISMTMGWLIGRAIAGQRSDVPVVSDYIVTFENGVLYIQKAPAVMSNGILEVT